MKNISFLSENLQFLEVNFSIYLNRRVFVMKVHCLLNLPLLASKVALTSLDVNNSTVVKWDVSQN